MKAKQLAALLLTLALALALTACGGKESQTTQPPQRSGGESQTAEGGGANDFGYDLTGVSPITIVMTSALNNTHCCYSLLTAIEHSKSQPLGMLGAICL